MMLSLVDIKSDDTESKVKEFRTHRILKSEMPTTYSTYFDDS